MNLRAILAQLTGLRRQLIYRTALDTIGVDASPNDLAPDEFGCAESVSLILNRAIGFPTITGTYTLNQRLQSDRRFAPTNTPRPGDIIISPTGMRLGPSKINNGHVGIVGNNNSIMSNDSYTGKWMANYTIDTWRKRYQQDGKYPVFFYTLV